MSLTLVDSPPPEFTVHTVIVRFAVGLVSNGPTENTTCDPGAQPHAWVPDVPPPDQRIAVKLDARG